MCVFDHNAIALHLYYSFHVMHVFNRRAIALHIISFTKMYVVDRPCGSIPSCSKSYSDACL